jgi:lipid II:glycine glycyltransferase (peptidoglycan interpeptide bridge formation enzyme)
MVRFLKNFGKFNVHEVWFADEKKFVDTFKLSVYMHPQKNSGCFFGLKNYSYTIENDLSLSLHEIFENCSKTVKIEVKQAQKQQVQCFFSNDIEAFVSFYNDFAKERQIDATSAKRLTEMLANLQLSFVTLDGIIVAAHGYLVDEQQKIVRLMLSASKRLSSVENKQQVGKINKLLHWHDFEYFKKQGFLKYDFGGFAKDTVDKGLDGINKFKQSFGGRIVLCKNVASIPYTALKKIAGLFGKLGGA